MMAQPTAEIFKKKKKIVVEVNWEHKIGQTLLVLLSDQKTKVRMGVIYGSQENITPKQELKNCMKASQTKLSPLENKSIRK